MGAGSEVWAYLLEDSAYRAGKPEHPPSPRIDRSARSAAPGLARHYSLPTHLASVPIADICYGTMLADPGQAIAACQTAGQQALEQDGVDLLILGGGPVTGLAPQPAKSLVACGYPTSRRRLYHPC